MYRLRRGAAGDCDGVGRVSTAQVPDRCRKARPGSFAPDDAVAFAEALDALLGDAERRERMARAGAAAGLALPGWEDTARVAGGVLDSV